MMTWQNNLPPTQATPAAAINSPHTISTTTATGGKAMVTVEVEVESGGPDHTAGVAIVRSATTITALDWTKVIAILPAHSGDTITFVDTPLTAGTYHYAAQPFSNDGKWGTIGSDESATAT
jgi:hypothetical protein